MSAVQSIDPPAPSEPLPSGSQGLDEWFRPEWETRAVATALGLFVVLWTAFQIISYQSVDLRDDLTEVFAWSRHPSASYYKHPPLAALIAAGWFKVFPISDWSFHLLAMVNAAIGLYFVDRIARRHLEPEKRLVVFALLLLTPFYQFHGQRFASNQVLLSTWPVATYCFLGAFETRRLSWSIAAGAAAALAMLGKYFSIYLVLAFVAAALSHPARWTYLRSPSPYISVLVGLALLAPHLLWLAENGPQTFAYAYEAHGSTSAWTLFSKTALYVGGGIAFVALMMLVYVVAVRPDGQTIRSAFWPDCPDRRMLVVLLALPLVLPIVTAPFLGILLSSIWTMPAWSLLPIVLLMPREAKVTRPVAARLAAGVLACAIIAVIAAPAVAIARFVEEADNQTARASYRDMSMELTNAWHQVAQRPLGIVMGNLILVLPVTFYSSDHPDSVPNFLRKSAPWVSDDRLEKEGWVGVCFKRYERCMAAAEELVDDAPNVVRMSYMAQKSWLGVEAPPVEIVFFLVPPRR